MAGFLPFSAIYIELHYIFASLWGHKIYTLFGILFLAFIMLIIVRNHSLYIPPKICMPSGDRLHHCVARVFPACARGLPLVVALTYLWGLHRSFYLCLFFLLLF